MGEQFGCSGSDVAIATRLRQVDGARHTAGLRTHDPGDAMTQPDDPTIPASRRHV
jgi:hypothetical protein